MKRDFVFVWGPDVLGAIAALSAPKIAQLRRCCDRLIARAEYYRQNPMLLIRIVEMPHLTDQDLPWAPFEKFGYWFKLEYQEHTRRYVLTFATPPEPDPPVRDCDNDAQPPRAARIERKRGPARPARVRRSPKATDKRNVSYKIGWNEIRPAIEALYGALWSSLTDNVRRMRNAGGTLSRLSRRPDDNSSCGVALTLRGVCASFRPSSERVPRRFSSEARLEPRLFGQNAGLHLLLYTLVRDEAPVDWSANLFGEPCQEGGC